MQVVQCERCGSTKRSGKPQCPHCELGIFKHRFYWIPMAAVLGLLMFSFARTGHDASNETQARLAIDQCRQSVAAEPHASQDPPAPCASLVEEFILKYGHQPD